MSQYEKGYALYLLLECVSSHGDILNGNFVVVLLNT